MKVAIIGGKAGRTKVPEGFEVWTINGMGRMWRMRAWPQTTRAFNIHPYENLVAYGYNTWLDSDWPLAEDADAIQFYMADRWKTWPKKRCINAEEEDKPPVYAPVKPHLIFPRKELRKMPRGDYHCGSFDWLVAFAIHLGAEEIRLHGIGLCLEAGEPISSRACLEYWCGYAEGRGIKVTAAKDCDPFHFYHLVKSNLVYGYDDTPIYEVRDVAKQRVRGRTRVPKRGPYR